ncbi:MAG: hypothetical protein GXZ06_10520 [Tissierellia bacterium]|nr:hypothetical protein [Tissierellia bacterium]
MEFNLGRRNYKVNEDKKEKSTYYETETGTEDSKEVVEERAINQEERAHIEEREEMENQGAKEAEKNYMMN